ncbi:MAG: hypothetical protein VCD00_13335 [Candidatus Hydrogenedentota bacterium]
MMYRLLFALLITTTIIVGCGQSTDEPTAEPEAIETASEPEATSTPEDTAETTEPAEPEGVPMPKALVGLVEVPPELTLTAAVMKDEASKQYHLEADTKLNVDKVQNFYMKVYPEKGWTEDMNMAQKGNTIIGYSNDDGFLLVVEAKKGGKGSKVTIDTGTL